MSQTDPRSGLDEGFPPSVFDARHGRFVELPWDRGIPRDHGAHASHRKLCRVIGRQVVKDGDGTIGEAGSIVAHRQRQKRLLIVEHQEHMDAQMLGNVHLLIEVASLCVPGTLGVGEPAAGVLQIPNDHGQQVLWKVLFHIVAPQELLQGVELSFGEERRGVELHLLLLGKI